jgi:hypothetical protein
VKTHAVLGGVVGGFEDINFTIGAIGGADCPAGLS